MKHNFFFGSMLIVKKQDIETIRLSNKLILGGT